MQLRIVFSAIFILTSAGSISAATQARYCLQGRDFGFPGNCRFATLQQCRAAAAGTLSSCGMNPRYARPRQ